MIRPLILGGVAAMGLAALACSTEHVTGLGPGRGQLAVRVSDAPVPFDSVKAVNVFVVRVDARRASMKDSADVDHDIDVSHGEDDAEARQDSTMWVTIASPDSAINFLALHGGVSAFLGATTVDSGHFKAIRLVIDPAKSNVVLKDGTVLTMQSTPPVEFENRGRHGLFVEFDNDVAVESGGTSTITLDLRLDQSLTLIGRGVRDGFLFRPVVTGHCDHSH